MNAIHNEHDVIDLAIAELHRARRMYPDWPTDPIRACSIVAEECGEVVQAVNDLYMHGKSSRQVIESETVQMIAMGIRFLVDTSALHSGDTVLDVFRQAALDQDTEIQRLRAEVQRLRSVRAQEESDYHALQAEVQRLTALVQQQSIEYDVRTARMVDYSPGKTHTSEWFVSQAGQVQP